MHKIGRWILLALFVAFLAGLMPTIFEWCDRFFVFTEEGLGVTRHFTHTVDSVFLTLKDYAWHITIIYAAVIAFVIFMEGQNPDRTILWMLALIFLPVFGVVLYLVIGPDFRSLRNRKRFRPSKRYGFDDTPFPKDVEEQFLIGRMLHACSGAELLMRNRVEILINGDKTFPAIEKALREAKNYIHMEFFIVRSDELGARIGALLKEAAGRGVKVRLLYDAVGSWSLKRSFVKDLEDAGIDCRSFMPVALPIFRRQMNFRNHRKIVVIDGAVGFTGGLNLGTEYEGRGPLGFWRDTFVRLEGEAVPELHKIFLNDWCVSSGEEPREGCECERDFYDGGAEGSSAGPAGAGRRKRRGQRLALHREGLLRHDFARARAGVDNVALPRAGAGADERDDSLVAFGRGRARYDSREEGPFPLLLGQPQLHRAAAALGRARLYVSKGLHPH